MSAPGFEPGSPALRAGAITTKLPKRSTNSVRAIKSRRFRWAGYVTRMLEGRSAFKILTGKPTGKRPRKI